MSHILIEEEKPEKVDMTTPLKALTLDYDLLWGEGGGERKRERGVKCSRKYQYFCVQQKSKLELEPHSVCAGRGRGREGWALKG